MPYRSGRTLAIASVVLVGLQLAIHLGMLVLCLLGLSSFEHLANVPFEALDYGARGLYILALVFFLCWVHRSVSNLDPLGTQRIVMRPARAVWSFFIPILNLVEPHQVLAQIWRESQPAEINEHGYRVLGRVTLVTSWWVAVWVATLLTRAERLIGTPTTLEEVRSALWFAALLSIAWTVAGGLFMKMVWRAQSRQDAQWRDLELRRGAPQPTADFLR